jgi:hypothetical protein
MYKYKALKNVEIGSGILELNKGQAAPRIRARQITDLGEGLYEVTGVVQFKAGEEFGYDGEVGKALSEKLALKKKK